MALLSATALKVPHHDVRLPNGTTLHAVGVAPPWHEPGMGDYQVYEGLLGLTVIASSDTSHHGTLLHLSLSHPTHLPGWDTVRAVKAAFFGNVDACMILPRQEDYVNLHRYCFHLWQLPVEWGLQ